MWSVLKMSLNTLCVLCEVLLRKQAHVWARTVYFRQNCMWMCLPTLKIWLSLYQFFCTNPTHHYTILERIPPNFAQIGCFCYNLLKIHPIYVIWTPSSLMKNHRSLYQISQNSIPKKAGTYTYTMSWCETPLCMWASGWLIHFLTG